MPRLAVLFPLVLTACGAPISNQVLYEDEIFIAALPSTERLAAPAEVRRARVGDSTVLAAAVHAAAELEDIGRLVAGSGEALRTATPDERSEVRRSWRAVPAAVKIGEETYSWSVRGEVLRPIETASVEWSLEISASGKAPWVAVGSGTHNGSSGQFDWEMAAQADVVGLPDPSASLVFDYVDADRSGRRARELQVEEPDSLLGRAWHGVDEVALSWVTDAQWTLDGATWPAAVEVVHDPGAGGWATGWLYTDAGETPIAVCWNADGDDVWIQGEGLPEIGVEADCPVAPLN